MEGRPTGMRAAPATAAQPVDSTYRHLRERHKKGGKFGRVEREEWETGDECLNEWTNCRTNFDAMAEKDDFFMEAQKLEMERLERLKKNRPSNDDHLQQFSALLSPHVQGPLPLLDVDAQDFDLEDVDGKPQSSVRRGRNRLEAGG